MPFNLCDNAGIEGVALEYERKDNKKGNKAILGKIMIHHAKGDEGKSKPLWCLVGEWKYGDEK